MNNAEIVAAYESLRKDYAVFAAETRACGYEVVSFAEWTGARNLKAEKEAKWQERFASDTQDLY